MPGTWIGDDATEWVGVPRDDRAVVVRLQGDHFDAVRVQDVRPFQLVGAVLRDQLTLGRGAVRPGHVGHLTAGVFVAPGQGAAQGSGSAVEKVGAQLVPTVFHVVDQVPGHGLQVAGEPVLVGGQEQRELVVGVAVEVDVHAGVSVGGGAGDDRAGGQVGLLK